MAGDLERSARLILEGNRRTADWRGEIYAYTVPSPARYPFQWFWDSCFHAIVLAKLGEIGQARKEIGSLLARQTAAGGIYHINYWDSGRMKLAPGAWNWMDTKPFFSFLPFFPKPETSALIQPPVLAQAVERIFQESSDRRWLKGVFPRLVRYYRWLAETRDFDRDGLISIIAPYESGADQSPAYDRILKAETPLGAVRAGRGVLLTDKILGFDPRLISLLGPFQVKDVLMNSIWGKNLRTMAALAQKLGETEKAAEFGRRADRVTRILLAKCWDEKEGIFWNLDGREERPAKIKTVLSLMPLILEDLPRDVSRRLVREHLANPKEFWLNYPVPSVAADEKSFAADRDPKRERDLWRGPTWVATNWFLSKGLEHHGYAKEAKILARKTRELVLKGGFREYYDPATGRPGAHSALSFGWSALATDL